MSNRPHPTGTPIGHAWFHTRPPPGPERPACCSNPIGHPSRPSDTHSHNSDTGVQQHKQQLPHNKAKYIKHIHDYFQSLSACLPKCVLCWSVAEVGTWLAVIGMSTLTLRFSKFVLLQAEQLAIDGSVLILLNQSDLIQQVGLKSQLALSAIIAWVDHGFINYQDYLTQMSQHQYKGSSAHCNKQRIVRMQKQFQNPEDIMPRFSSIKDSVEYHQKSRLKYTTVPTYYDSSSHFKYEQSNTNASNNLYSLQCPWGMTNTSKHAQIQQPMCNHKNRYTQHNIQKLQNINKKQGKDVRILEVCDKQSNLCIQINEYPFYLISQFDQMHRDNHHSLTNLNGSKSCKEQRNRAMRMYQFEQAGRYNFDEEDHSRYLEKKNRNHTLSTISLRQELKIPIHAQKYSQKQNKYKYMNKSIDCDRNQYYDGQQWNEKWMQYEWDISNLEIVVNKIKVPAQGNNQYQKQYEEQYALSMVIRGNYRDRGGYFGNGLTINKYDEDTEEYMQLYNKINTVKRYSHLFEDTQPQYWEDDTRQLHVQRDQSRKHKHTQDNKQDKQHCGQGDECDINAYMLLREVTQIQATQDKYRQRTGKYQREYDGQSQQRQQQIVWDQKQYKNRQYHKQGSRRFYNGTFKFVIEQFQFTPYSDADKPTLMTIIVRTDQHQVGQLQVKSGWPTPYDIKHISHISIAQLHKHLPTAIEGIYSISYICIEGTRVQLQQPTQQSTQEWKQSCGHYVVAALVYICENDRFYICKAEGHQAEHFVIDNIKHLISANSNIQVYEQQQKCTPQKSMGIRCKQPTSQHSHSLANASMRKVYQSYKEQSYNLASSNSKWGYSSTKADTKIWIKLGLSYRIPYNNKQKYPSSHRYDSHIKVRNGACIKIGRRQLIFNVNRTTLKYVEPTHPHSTIGSQWQALGRHINNVMYRQQGGEDGQENWNRCIICYEKPNNCIYLECRHNVTCLSCGKLLEECPICRAPIVDYLRLYTC